MAKIFLSHSSVDNGPAMALAEWLGENGWAEYFLDLEPERGIAAGERWERALYQAATRCEAVLFLISRNWLASAWCLREMELAYKLNKHIFGVLIDDTSRTAVPKTISPWQMVNLHQGQDHAWIEVKLPNQGITQVTFSRSGLAALKEGLSRAQIDPVHFNWPPEGEPDRAPWRGLEPLDSKDAGIFFGRDGQIIGALDKIRALREAAPPRLMPIIGASGAGKSSFLRAGLIPRLKRDDRNYLVLPVIRPEGGGLKALTASLSQTALDLKLGVAQHDFGKAVLQAAKGNPEELSALLTRMAEAARPPIINGEAAPPPAIVLPIDQGEELFHSSGRNEESVYLSLLAGLLLTDRPRLLTLVTIRSDSYDQMQRARELEEIRHEAFSLPPLARGNYVDVIRRPLEVLNLHLSNSGASLKFDPAIIERLTATLDEGGGRDALPLLAFTLARLYCDFHTRGHISVADYDAIGGIGGSINAAVDSALVRASRDRRTTAGDAEDMLRQTMIPRFAGIDPETGTARRRAARYDVLPSETRPLVDALIAERLLTRDNGTVEPAHEALLREWKALTQWLVEDRERLITLEGVRRAAADWQANGRHKDYLAHRDGRLASADGLVQRPDLWGGLVEIDHAYLCACHEAEDAARVQREADLDAKKKAIRKEKRAVRIGGTVASALLLAAAGLGWFAWDRDEKAQQAEVDALALLALSRAESDPLDALKLVLGVWPQTEVRTFPLPSAAFPAISTALNRTRSHMLLLGHEGGVYGIAFSPDGRRIVSGGEDGLHFWDAETGMQISGPISEHRYGVRAVAFSPDGTQIASSEIGNGTLRLWDAKTGAPIDVLPTGYKSFVNCVVLSPDGTVIVSGDISGALRLWDVKTRTQVGELNHKGGVTDVAFSPDGTRLVSGGSDGLRLWDVKARAQIGEPMAGQMGGIQRVIFSPDGKLIASADRVGMLRLWDAATWAQFGKPMIANENEVHSIAFSPDGTQVVSGDSFGALRFWNVESQTQIGEPVIIHKNNVIAIVFSPDGKRIVSGGADGTLRLWDAKPLTQQIGEPMRGHVNWVKTIALSSDGTHIVSGSVDHTLRLWDAETGAQIGAPMLGHEGWVNSVAFSPSGTHIVSGDQVGTLRLWDVDTPTQIGGPMIGHEGPVNSVAFSPTGRRIISAGADGTLRVWDVATGAQISEITTGHGWVNSVAFSFDGKRMVSGGYDNMLRLWDATTGAQIGKPLAGHKSVVSSVAFSPDGESIVSGSFDNTLRLWDAETGAQIGALMLGHENLVASVAFSRDGTRIVSGDQVGTLRLWDAKTGAQIGEPIREYEGLVLSVSFSPEGTRIVSGGSDGTLRFWNVDYPFGNLLQVACYNLPVIDGRPAPSTDGLTARIVNRELSLPTDCDNYNPPLPLEYQ